MNDDDPLADQVVALRVRIAKLRQEHQDLAQRLIAQREQRLVDAAGL